MNMTRASRGPSPKTVRVPLFHRSQARHFLAALATARNEFGDEGAG
jgi:hypothetical protein